MRNSWRKKEKSHIDELRNTTRWRTLREVILRHNPLCAVCAELGRNAPATEVHHIIPAAEMVKRYGDEGFFREDNLIPLCCRCHDRNENAYIHGVEDVVFPKSRRGRME